MFVLENIDEDEHARQILLNQYGQDNLPTSEKDQNCGRNLLFL
jgi:hypothetical protein